MKHLRMIPIALVISLSALHAAGQIQSGFEFLRTSLHARPAAMGNAFEGSVGDLSSVAYNPAGLSGVNRKSVLFTYLDYFADFKAGSIVYGLPRTDGSVIGLSAAYMSYGEMKWTDIRGEVTGSSAPGDLLISASYARPWSEAISYGISLKYIRSQIDQYNADAVATDIGAVLQMHGDLNIGISARNLGVAISGFIDEKEKLPASISGGCSKTLAHLPLTLHFHLLRYLYHESDQLLGLYWTVGGEFKLSESVFFRWGYNSIGEEQKVGTDSERLTGISLGFGFMLSRFRIDYAFGNHGVLETTHRFTLAYDL